MALGGGDHVGLILLANAEDVANTGGEGLTLGILDVDDIEATRVLVTGSDGSHTTVILTLGHHTGGTSLELDDVGDLAGGKVNLDNVVHTHKRIRVADGAAIVGGDGRDALGTESKPVDTAKLEGVLVSLVEGDDVVESTWEVGVSAAAAVNLHETH